MLAHHLCLLLLLVGPLRLLKPAAATAAAANAAVQAPRTATRWDHVDITLTGGPVGNATFNPYLDVDVAATFTLASTPRAAAATTTIAGFCDGNGTFIIRFMPDRVGTWSYTTRSMAAPTLDGHTGTVAVSAPSTAAAVHNRGVARHTTSGFVYDNGDPYVPVGTTSYAWLHQPQGDALEEVTLASLQASPFNKLRMTIFPKVSVCCFSWLINWLLSVGF